MSIFNLIRESCERVSYDALWVEIDLDVLMTYPESLLSGHSVDLSHSPQHHLLNKEDDTLIFFLILDTINFGSGYFPYMEKVDGESGYFTIAGRLTKYFRENGIPSARQLSELSAVKFAEIFGQKYSENKHMRELMRYFNLAISELGSWVTSKYDGDYLGFLKEAKSADQAISSLLEMPMFRDCATYFGSEVWFAKRAQIVLQDMKMAYPDHKLLQFPDIESLTVFADNVLPYVLRLDGILKCDPWLESRISSEEIIPAGSTEEVELRACSVHAAEMVANTIREEMRPISVRELDFLLWSRGQELKKTSTMKRHRTRTFFY